MSRTWTFFIMIAAVLMSVVFVYELYVSVSGGNVTFSKTVIPIESTLGTNNLFTFEANYENLLIKTEDLDDK
jgi:hypothetical protein